MSLTIYGVGMRNLPSLGSFYFALNFSEIGDIVKIEIAPKGGFELSTDKGIDNIIRV